MQLKYDAVVIGSGPAGEGSAMHLSKKGFKVAVIEAYHKIGGNCTHKGTIPSKSLRQMIKFDQHNLTSPKGPLTFLDCLKESKITIQSQVNLKNGFYIKNNVDIHFGKGYFLSKNKLRIRSDSGIEKIIEANYFIIAVGSSPYRSQEIDFNNKRVFDSDTILKLDHHPKSVIIFGAGVIGCEYASILQGMGIAVELINQREELLEFLDPQIVHALSYHFMKNGVRIHNNEDFKGISYHEGYVKIQLKAKKEVYADILLWANGRSGNTMDLGLENIGITTDSRGQILVNKHYQTEKKHIFAVGDVIGQPSLASASYDQGRICADYIVTGKINKSFIRLIPTGIYTNPEISSLGENEKTLLSKNIPYEIGIAWFESVARAQIMNERIGMLKLIFNRETFQILGIHCFGDQAAEIVHIGQAIMAQKGKGNDVRYFTNITFNYPTMAEAYRIAAMNGLNRMK